MNEDLNRNTYGDLVRRQYEKMDPLDPMVDIPEDETRGIGTHTSQSLSSEEADHSGFSQEEAGPADAELGVRLNPDPSALTAWEATGAEPQSLDSDEGLPEGAPAGRSTDGTEGLVEEAKGRLPLDHVPADAAMSLDQDANETYPRMSPQYNPAFNEEARTAGQGSRNEPSIDEGQDDELEDIPDADELQAGSPVDPAVPEGTDQHGIDLLNGVGGVDDETGRKLPDDM